MVYVTSGLIMFHLLDSKNSIEQLAALLRLETRRRLAAKLNTHSAFQENRLFRVNLTIRNNPSGSIAVFHNLSSGQANENR